MRSKGPKMVNVFYGTLLPEKEGIHGYRISVL